MYITRLQAIDIAVSAIKQLPDSAENRQAAERLLNIKNDCRIICWTKETVFQTLDEWSAEHGRYPTVTDLAEPNMPKAVTVKKLFDMKASAFLNTYYSSEKKKARIGRYSCRTGEEWAEDFVSRYNSIRPSSAREYNIRRDRNSPTWLTVARHLGVSTWKELLEFTGVKKDNTNGSHGYTVEHSSPAYERISRLLEERK